MRSQSSIDILGWSQNHEYILPEGYRPSVKKKAKAYCTSDSCCNYRDKRITRSTNYECSINKREKAVFVTEDKSRITCPRCRAALFWYME